MSTFFGQIEFLRPMIEPSTLADGRGGIFSWIPEDEIREFSMLYFFPGKVRGNHYHPEFVEYFLVVEGEIVLTTVDALTNQQLRTLCGKGSCFRTPPSISHSVQAITNATCVSLITKPWNSVKNPIIFSDLTPFDPEYLEYVKDSKSSPTVSDSLKGD